MRVILIAVFTATLTLCALLEADRRAYVDVMRHLPAVDPDAQSHTVLTTHNGRPMWIIIDTSPSDVDEYLPQQPGQLLGKTAAHRM